jgi:hypothetical protein
MYCAGRDTSYVTPLISTASYSEALHYISRLLASLACLHAVSSYSNTTSFFKYKFVQLEDGEGGDKPINLNKCRLPTLKRKAFHLFVLNTSKSLSRSVRVGLRFNV